MYVLLTKIICFVSLDGVSTFVVVSGCECFFPAIVIHIYNLSTKHTSYIYMVSLRVPYKTLNTVAGQIITTNTFSKKYFRN